MNVSQTVAVLLADPIVVWNWHDKVAWGFNIGLALSGILGIFIAVGTLKAIKRQAEIANRTLIAQFRPKIQVRAIHLNETTDALLIEIVLANKGDTSGHISDVSVKVSWIYDHSPELPEISTSVFRPFSLLPGEDTSFTIDLSVKWITFRIAANYVDDGHPQSMSLQCDGQIIYSDDNNTKRKTGFRRIYDLKSKRFVVSQTDPEFEYAD